MMRRSTRIWCGSLLGFLGLAICAKANEAAPGAASAETIARFQNIEQDLMSSVANGRKEVWDRVMDPSCVITSEEGEVIGKRQFLAEFRPLPPGLAGGIEVKELTVAEFPDFAVVRYLADEWETVFGQRLTTKYRTTDTFRRIGKDWKLAASHTSVVTQDPPAQAVSRAGWAKFAGQYRLLPDGWMFTVELREGTLYGGRDPAKLKPFVPLTPDTFVLSGSLGEWTFVTDSQDHVSHIVELRKFEPLIWTRLPQKQTN